MPLGKREVNVMVILSEVAVVEDNKVLQDASLKSLTVFPEPKPEILMVGLLLIPGADAGFSNVRGLGALGGCP